MGVVVGRAVVVSYLAGGLERLRFLGGCHRLLLFCCRLGALFGWVLAMAVEAGECTGAWTSFGKLHGQCPASRWKECGLLEGQKGHLPVEDGGCTR